MSSNLGMHPFHNFRLDGSYVEFCSVIMLKSSAELPTLSIFK